MKDTHLKESKIRKFWDSLFKAEKRQFNPENYSINTYNSIYETNIEEALKVNTVHACVNLIASSIACLPLNLYRKEETGREKATEHRLYRIFKDPNYYMTGVAFLNALVTNLLLYGNAYIEKIESGGQLQLNVIPSKYVKIDITKPGKITYQINVGTEESTVKNKTKVCDYKSIVHIVGESLDGIHGISPVSKLSKTIEFAKTLETYGALYFENGAYPSGVIKLPPGKNLSQEAAERLRKAFEKKYSGVINSNKTIVLEEGAEFETKQAGNDSSQFLQTKDELVEEVARIFNVPLHLIQKTDKQTSWGTGIEQMGINFVTYTLGAHMSRIAEAVNKGLLAPEEREKYYFEFDTKSLLKGDVESRYRAYEIGLRCGFISPNEIRQKENMPPIDGGNVYCMQLSQPPYAGEDMDDYLDHIKELEKENGDTI